MESGTDAAAADSAARTFSQVLFTDIPHSYPPSTALTCCYTLTEAFQPHPRDWVGIFKVGWSTTKDYHTFVWVEQCQDAAGQLSMTRHAFFKDYYLPKDEIEFYQFCYVDSTGQVRGASTPFCFKNPVEQSMESSTDDDLLVITTQEQVEQSVREKAEMMKELEQIREENESLKTALQKEQQEVDCLKGQNGQKEKEKSELVKEVDQMKEQNGNLKRALQEQLQEMGRLKEEMLVQMAKQMEMEQQNYTTTQQNLSQSASLDGESKQNEEERAELRAKIEVQSDEIAKLNSELREGQRQLFKMNDSIQLLQVDLQSSEKENERLSAELQQLHSITHNMDEVQRENQELCGRLAQQEVLQQSFPDEDLKEQSETLRSQLQDVQVKLAQEKEHSYNIKKRAELLERELQKTREQLDNVVTSQEQAQRKSSKLEIQLREAHEAIADKDGIIEEKEHMITLFDREKRELTRENKNLRDDIEELRKVYTDCPTAPPDPTTAAGTTAAGTAASSHDRQQQETPELTETLYETIRTIPETEEEKLLVCRLCHESFPGITQNELELHEQSHRTCPFCAMICDNMEQSKYEDHVYSHEE
ncbi:hypothetical protein PAMA_012167 [Pampus argenteus]